jgi:hypothetical protein
VDVLALLLCGRIKFICCAQKPPLGEHGFTLGVLYGVCLISASPRASRAMEMEEAIKEDSETIGGPQRGIPMFTRLHSDAFGLEDNPFA